MTTLIIPNIGDSGFYPLQAPFDALVVNNQRYTCQAVRNIGDYLANNEDPYSTVYKPYGLTEALYKEHCKQNMFIVSLQSDTGQWIYIPASHILGFPVTNGVEYHTVMIGLGLGLMPTSYDFTALETKLNSLIWDTLGISPEIKTLQVSKPILVANDKHEIVQTVRDGRKKLELSDSAKLAVLQEQYDALALKLQALETFIEEKKDLLI